MEGSNPDSECSLQKVIHDSHAETMSTIHELEATIEKCKQAKEEKQRLMDKRSTQDSESDNQEGTSTSTLLHLAQRLLEARDSRRKSSIHHATTSQNSEHHLSLH
jgi:hypothetical protein